MTDEAEQEPQWVRAWRALILGFILGFTGGFLAGFALGLHKPWLQ